MDMSKERKKQQEPDARNDQIEDYKMSRQIYLRLIQSGMGGLEVLEELAKDSEHPRAFEIMGSYIKNIGDLNDKMIDLQRKMQVIRQEEGIEAAKQLESEDPQKRIAFNGSTSDLGEELNRLLLEAQNKDVVDAEFEEVNDYGPESED